MADKEFVDIGDELVVRVGEYPVATATITDTAFNGDWIAEVWYRGYILGTIYLPPDFKNHDVDGVAHKIGHPIEGMSGKRIPMKRSAITGHFVNDARYRHSDGRVCKRLVEDSNTFLHLEDGWLTCKREHDA